MTKCNSINPEVNSSGLDFAKPKIMAVINLAPESFFSAGRLNDAEAVLNYAHELMAAGADIIDIGAEATNPVSNFNLSLQQELDRLIPILQRLKQQLSIPISVDTSQPEVMKLAIELGVEIINDVRAFRREGALAAVANSNVMLCIMHMLYPEEKSCDTEYQTINPNSISDIKNFLFERIKDCKAAGIKQSRLIIDPGLGGGNFGKNTADNLRILNHLSEFRQLNIPILIGASRKTFIGDILQKPASERLIGSLAVAAIAVYNGAAIIRTHDVKETVDAIKIAMEIRNAN